MAKKIKRLITICGNLMRQYKVEFIVGFINSIAVAILFYIYATNSG
jgi:hypothetical protein